MSSKAGKLLTITLLSLSMLGIGGFSIFSITININKGSTNPPSVTASLSNESTSSQVPIESPDSGREAASIASSKATASSTGADFVLLKDIQWTSASSDNGGFLYYDTVKDNLGALYDNGIGGTGDDSFQEYQLNNTYSLMTGRVVLNYDYRTYTNENLYLTILGDGKTLYQSPEIMAGVEPADFSISLKGVNTLRVEINGQNVIRLVDCILQK